MNWPSACQLEIRFGELGQVPQLWFVNVTVLVAKACINFYLNIVLYKTSDCNRQKSFGGDT